MKKRLIAIFLALLLSFCVSGCVSENKADEPVTVIWYIPGDSQEDIDLINEKASEITMEKIGVKLKIEFMDMLTFGDRMAMNFTGNNDEFDLTFTGYLNRYGETAMRGAYLPLDEYIENSEIIKNTVPDYVLEASRRNGHIYAVANMQVLPSGTGLFVQEKLAKEYGLDVSKIHYLDDIEPFLAWVKETHPEVYPFRSGRVGGGLENDGVWGQNIGYAVRVRKDADGNFVVRTYAEDAEEFDTTAEYRLIHEWYKKGYIRQDVAGVIDDTKEHNAGKFAVWRGVYKPGGDAEFNAAHPDNCCIMIQISKPEMELGVGSNTMTAINVNSKHPDEAFKVIELANSDKEFYNLICYGIEGVHYDFDENGRVVYRKNSGYAPKAAWKFGSVFNSYLLPGQPDDLWDITADFNNSAEKSPLEGFHLDEYPIRLHLSRTVAVDSKYKIMRENGICSVDEWYGEYLSELEKAGAEEIKKEVQRQLDEWAAAEK